MRRYWIASAAVSCLLLVAFLVVEALDVPLLTDPAQRLKQADALAALLGVSLLVADVVIPIPSSLIMVAHGTLFGVPVGTCLSLIGSTGAAMTAFALGRRSSPLLARLVPPAERARAARLLWRWGPAAIVATRPVPLLAETVAIMAGASEMPWGRAALAAAAGSLPPALLYALAGVVTTRFGSPVLVLGLVLTVATGVGLSSRWRRPRPTRSR